MQGIRKGRPQHQQQKPNAFISRNLLGVQNRGQSVANSTVLQLLRKQQGKRIKNKHKLFQPKVPRKPTMKLISLFFLAFVALTAAKVVPVSNGINLSIDQHGRRAYADEVEDKCDYYCAKKDPSVCATNGQCLLKFESHCAMTAYNCRNPQKEFKTVEDHRCLQDWQPLCTEADLREFGL